MLSGLGSNVFIAEVMASTPVERSVIAVATNVLLAGVLRRNFIEAVLIAVNVRLRNHQGSDDVILDNCNGLNAILKQIAENTDELGKSGYFSLGPDALVWTVGLV
jgi:hypothetical protein